jgi:hypothetical protein
MQAATPWCVRLVKQAPLASVTCNMQAAQTTTDTGRVKALYFCTYVREHKSWGVLGVESCAKGAHICHSAGCSSSSTQAGLSLHAQQKFIHVITLPGIAQCTVLTSQCCFGSGVPLLPFLNRRRRVGTSCACVQSLLEHVYCCATGCICAFPAVSLDSNTRCV